MEQQNLPTIAKKVWSIVRVVYFMLRKGISKRKLLLDLNMMLKRGKIAGKALGNLIAAFHHHHHHRRGSQAVDPHRLDYEFSCSNSPAFPGIFHLHNKRRHHHLNPFACTHAPPTSDDSHTLNAVKAVLEMLGNSDSSLPVEASPALPGFGRSPAVRVRQLRITDSPFPLTEADEDSKMVDNAAEEFIQRFYRELKQQKSTRSSS